MSVNDITELTTAYEGHGELVLSATGETDEHDTAVGIPGVPYPNASALTFKMDDKELFPDERRELVVGPDVRLRPAEPLELVVGPIPRVPNVSVLTFKMDDKERRQLVTYVSTAYVAQR
ncbi:hypothetical protein DPMN_186519 [Dreissena polymorpha]|uniref:Uncharacterized protein n=1 Tax=Dreissena polymorpha TaxID=45954 RepID=A0A9D4DPS3_DREPO|nr:hypothetical protein DPMN_186519 [Dreissena polymorpha]